MSTYRISGTCTSAQMESFFDREGIKHTRFILKTGEKTFLLDCREKDAGRIDQGDFIAAVVEEETGRAVCFVNPYRNFAWGRGSYSLMQEFEKYKVRVVSGKVRHKERNRTSDDLSRPGYHTGVYFRVVLESGEDFYANERDGLKLFEGDEIRVALSHGGAETLAVRNLSNGYRSGVSLTRKVTFGAVPLVMIGFAIWVVATQKVTNNGMYAIAAIMGVIPSVFMWWPLLKELKDARKGQSYLD